MAEAVFSPTLYTKYPLSMNKECIGCHKKVKYRYPSRKRHYLDFSGTFNEVRYNYACENPSCNLYGITYNPAPIFALPFKHYSLSVWKWIGREGKQYNQNAAKISERIKNEFGMKISENTIRNILDELDIYLSQQIDEKTKKIVQTQGKIVLALDGQKPDDGENALWLFVDVISNRVLKVVNLRHADHLTLHDLVKSILSEYDVELAGLLSDKQGSIVKMRDVYYPKVPHQYCQFHFLQNMWNHVEMKDTHLHQKLRSTINHLRITTISKVGEFSHPDFGKVNYRDFFKEIESDLRKLIKNRGKKLEKLRGIVAFEKISDYLADMDEIINSQDPNHRVTKILLKTAQDLRRVLETESSNYRSCKTLLDWFLEVKSILGKPKIIREERVKKLSVSFSKIWEKVRYKGEFSRLSDLRTRIANASMSLEDVGQQWVRLYRSYKRGLFAYYDFPTPERTNSKMEAQFGHEKSTLMSRSGKSNVGRQIRVRGVHILKQQYAGKEEIKDQIERLPGSYNTKEVKKGMVELNFTQREESNRWQSRLGGKDAILRLYSHEKSKKGGT